MKVLILGILLCGLSLAEAGASSSSEDEYVRTKLSTLWTVQSLNIVATDLLSSLVPGWKEELVRFAEGEENVKYYMLAGAIIYEIPISMIFLSRYLPHTANRWANVGAAAVTALLLVGGGNGEPHYYLMAGIELATLGYIAWTAIRWNESGEGSDPGEVPLEKAGTGFRMQLDPISESCGLKYSFGF